MGASQRQAPARAQIRAAEADRAVHRRFRLREARLIVEVDGATHASDEEIGYDRRREACLRSSGYRVVRVANDDVYHRLHDVLETILAALAGRR